MTAEAEARQQERGAERPADRFDLTELESLAGGSTFVKGEAYFREGREELADLGGDGSYDAAAGLVARIGALRDSEAQGAYVAGLRTRHARKRNFMKRLM